MSNMSSPLSEVDRELLGESPYGNETEATTMYENGGPGHEAHKESQGTGFTALNAAAGTLVKMSSSGDEAVAGKVSQTCVLHLTFSLPSTIFPSFNLLTSQQQSVVFQTTALRSFHSRSFLCLSHLTHCHNMFDNTYTMSTPSQRAQGLQSLSTPQVLVCFLEMLRVSILAVFMLSSPLTLRDY